MNLSKSRYCKGIQCPKVLWMDKSMPGEFDKSVMVMILGELYELI